MRALAALALAGWLLLPTPSPLAAQANLSTAEWKSESDHGSGYTLSSDAKTMTLQLPATAQIANPFSFRIWVKFTTNQPPNHVMVPVHSNKPNILFCFEVPAGTVPSNRTKDTVCRMDAAAARAVTSQQIITVTVAGTNGNKTLTAVVKPYTGPNHVATLEKISATIRPGDLATFRIKLMSPVASGQTQTVGWGLTPRECFENASQSSPYSSTWTLNSVNTVTFQAGEIQRDVTFRVSTASNCVGAGRLLETWFPNTPTVQTVPTYRSLAFTISQPVPY